MSIESWTSFPKIIKDTWIGVPSGVFAPQACGDYSMFGGLGNFDINTKLQRRFSDLGKHFKILLQFYFFKLDAWNDGSMIQVIAGGKIVSELTFSSDSDDSTGSICGTYIVTLID